MTKESANAQPASTDANVSVVDSPRGGGGSSLSQDIRTSGGWWNLPKKSRLALLCMQATYTLLLLVGIDQLLFVISVFTILIPLFVMLILL